MIYIQWETDVDFLFLAVQGPLWSHQHRSYPKLKNSLTSTDIHQDVLIPYILNHNLTRLLLNAEKMFVFYQIVPVEEKKFLVSITAFAMLYLVAKFCLLPAQNGATCY